MKKINYLFTLLLALVFCGNAWGVDVARVTKPNGDLRGPYTSFYDAVKYANSYENCTVTLLIDYSEFTCLAMTKSIIIDLNSKTLSQPTDKAQHLELSVTATNSTFTIKNGTVNLPVFDNTSRGLIYNRVKSGSCVGVQNIILNNVSLSVKDGQNVLYNMLKGAQVTTADSVSLVGGIYSSDSMTITNNGNLTMSVQLPSNVTFTNKGNLIINGGTYDSKFTGNYTINGGKFLNTVFNKDTLEKHVALGKDIQDNGTYFVVTTAVANAEAKVNGVSYATFTEALAEVNKTAGCTLKLMKDINYSGNDLTLKKDVTIDFNGKTLTLGADFHFYCKTANVTLKSTGAQGTLKSGTKPSNSIYLYQPNSTLTLENVSVSGGEKTDIKVENNATNSTIILKAGTVLSKTIDCNSIATTINNGLNLSSIPYINGTNVTLINSGTMPVTLSGLQANVTNSGTLNIVDGTSDKNFNFTNTGTINILYGTFNGSSMTVSGGTTNITGGLFSPAIYNDPSFSSKLAAGYSGAPITIQADGYYRVVPTAQVSSVQYDGKTYPTLNDALDKVPAETAATIKLLANTTIIKSTSISGKRTITLDMNGNNMSSDFGVSVDSDNSLDIIGTGTITSTVDFITLNSAVRPDTTTLAKLHIGSGVTLDCGTAAAVKAMPVSNKTKGQEYAYGIRANIEGKIKSLLYVNGAIQENVDYDSPEFILAATSETNGIYAAGYGRWTINGGSHNGKVEVRAGEMTINDGTFVNLDTDTVVFEKNDDGPTVKSGSCNIAMAQHNTKQPVIITIKGGTFYAVSPIAQANPQENVEETAKLVKCYIKGGLFTSTNDKQEILRSQEQNRIFATAGFYNTKPAAKCIAQGYEAIAITDQDYPTQYAAGYRWRVGLPGQQGTTETTKGGDWNSTEIWKDGVVPTMSTQATIKNDLVVTTVAYAYGVKFDGGKVTIKDNGILVVSKGLVTGATAANFKIEGNGQLAIVPETLCQPQATVEYVAKLAGKKKDVTKVETVDDVYWEQMAIPTAAAPASFTEPADCGDAYYYNTWDITEAWQKVQKSDVKDPFTGYFMTNFSDYSATAKTKAYTFTGALAGNKVNTLNFIREGYTFFGNSCLAPMSIPELLMELNTNDIQATVYVYRPLTSNYFTINMATVGRGGRPTEINKLQGFFVYAKKKTSAAPTYSNVVWNPLLAKLSMGAPARKAAMQSEFSSAATLTITSAKGWSDDVVLFEGENLTNEFDQNYDAQKMMGDYVNVYVPATQKMAVHAVADLENTPITVATTNEVAYTFTFSDLEGAQLELVDAETQTVTPMVEGGSYEFVAQANTTIAGRFSVRKAPDTATDIQAVGAQQAQKGIYTVMGQYLGEASMWDALPTGVYVVNGQKVVK